MRANWLGRHRLHACGRLRKRTHPCCVSYALSTPNPGSTTAAGLGVALGMGFAPELTGHDGLTIAIYRKGSSYFIRYAIWSDGILVDDLIFSSPPASRWIHGRSLRSSARRRSAGRSPTTIFSSFTTSCTTAHRGTKPCRTFSITDPLESRTVEASVANRGAVECITVCS